MPRKSIVALGVSLLIINFLNQRDAIASMNRTGNQCTTGTISKLRKVVKMESDDNVMKMKNAQEEITKNAETNAIDLDNSSQKTTDERFCSECGEIIKKKAELCVHCGVRQAMVSSSKPKLTNEQSAYIETRVANDGKNTGVALLLWFFIGTLSVHRFYLRRPITAVLQIVSYLFLVGIIWWIVDAFLLSGMVREENRKIRHQLRLQLLSGDLPTGEWW